MPAENGYRPDIDGLRALAVVAVVWFHAFPNNWPSGFIGVDIFFVISGYLISTILFRQFESGSYSFFQFTGRRIRRIFPALATVLTTAFVASWLLLGQKEFVAFAAQLAGGSLFYANILFWTQHGYFDTASEFKPLLHLWSLGLEEQFYLFYPPLLWLTYRLKWNVAGTLIVGFALSFAGNVFATQYAPEFAFFQIPTRFWEFICGAFIAILVARDRFRAMTPTRKAWLSNFTSLVGFAMLAVALIHIRRGNFPGCWALLPTFGTALIIFAGPNAWLNYLLFSFRPLVALGLISYPLYLWHWPLLSFEYILTGERPALHHLRNALWLSVALSVLTYFVVEKPLRQISILRTFKFLAPLALVGGFAALSVIIFDGFPNRFAVCPIELNQGEIDHVTFHNYGNESFLPCEDPVFVEHALHYQGSSRCHQSKPGTEYDIILLGDSHAEQLFYGLATELPEKNITFAVNYGLPVRDNGAFEPIYRYLLNANLKRRVTIILSGGWVWHYNETEMYLGVGASVDSLKKAGYRVFVAEDIPSFPFEPTRCKMRRHFALNEVRCSDGSPSMHDQNNWVRSEIARVGKLTGAGVLRTYEFFKDDAGYFMAKDGRLLYRDRQHLTVNGSLYVSAQLKKTGQLKSLLATP